MEYSLRTAVVDMKKQEEAGINYIYAKTYNYVYLRAKNIMLKEADVQQLMRDVYVKMVESSAEIEVENLYEWLGECTYRLGCGYYIKKKAREVEYLESEEMDFLPRMVEYPEATSDVIAKSLEQLPDLYQATFYAFYYDYLSVEKIADLTGCTEGVVMNRLNYTRKYMIEALENRKEETKINVFYSVEGVCVALHKWSMDHCLGITAAQTVYAEICKNVNVKPAPIYLEGKEFAGVKNTVVYHKADDYAFIEEQMAKYGKKIKSGRKMFGLLAGVALLVVAVVLLVAAIAGGERDKQEDKNEPPVKVEEEQKPDVEETDKKEPVEKEPIEKEPEENDNTITQTDSAEYIFPDSHTRKLTREEIMALSPEQQRIAKNEIFARNGMIFGDQQLQSYFESKSWYKPSIPFDDYYNRVEMNMIEEANIGLFLEIEGNAP